MDDIFYDIGLSFASTTDHMKKRTVFRRPIVILIMNISYIITGIISILVNDEYWLFLLGDTGHVIGLKYHMRALTISLCLMTISYQAIHYYNHKHGIALKNIRVHNGINHQDRLVKNVDKLF